MITIISRHSESLKYKHQCKTLHLQVIEYAADLREYWKRGYGHDINRKASCILFHDLFSRLDKAANEKRQVDFKTDLSNLKQVSLIFPSCCIAVSGQARR